MVEIRSVVVRGGEKVVGGTGRGREPALGCDKYVYSKPVALNLPNTTTL